MTAQQLFSAQRPQATAVLFVATLFSSALLMFMIQPMFGKLLLPLLGGSPGVWNTCMVFYQSVLFLGYCYAHWISTRLAKKQQLALHATLLILSVLSLPIGLPINVSPPQETDPTFWIVSTLAIAIGLPFFVVATTAPLLQKWFAQLGQQTSQDPYYLYAASNAGSLLALLSYPFVLEPYLGVSSQTGWWSMAYVGLSICILGCAGLFWRTETATTFKTSLAIAPLANKTKLHWLALSFVPSSLLLGLTNFISTDIASVPLLWLIPLILYLLSFILVFSKWSSWLHPWMLRIQPLVLLPFIAFSFINPAAIPYWLDLSLHALSFFLSIMVCHGELAKQRPGTEHLTHFYLLMSLAGMLGGMFNTLIAPFLFNAVYEYPVMLVAALLLRPGLPQNKSALIKQLILPLLVLVLGFASFTLGDTLMTYLDSVGVVLILLVGLSYHYKSRTLSFGLLLGVILLFTSALHRMMSNTLYQERSFFGVLAARETVLENEQGQPETVRELFHGTTKHGAQRLSPELQTTPLTYYSRPGPIGQLFATFDAVNAHWTIGSVGLGAGALACYAKPTQTWLFYEIDPVVVKTARNPDYFTYLSRCAPNAHIAIGDARLSLTKVPDQTFDLLIMDAFSSDAVPTHLLTQEALRLYMAKLKPQGMLAFHITNRHLTLKNILADHAQQLHLAGLIQEFTPQTLAPLIVATDWVVLAKAADSLQPLVRSGLGHWQQLPLAFDFKPWTDDFTNIISIWK